MDAHTPARPRRSPLSAHGNVRASQGCGHTDYIFYFYHSFHSSCRWNLQVYRLVKILYFLGILSFESSGLGIKKVLCAWKGGWAILGDIFDGLINIVVAQPWDLPLARLPSRRSRTVHMPRHDSLRLFDNSLSPSRLFNYAALLYFWNSCHNVFIQTPHIYLPKTLSKDLEKTI